MAMLQTGRYLQEYCPAEGEKSIEELLRQLKVYYARSKLVYVISKGDFRIEDPEECRRQLRPFLGRKMIWLLEECPSGLKDCFQGIPLRILSEGTEKAAD